MTYSSKIQSELEYIDSPGFILGEFIYIGMIKYENVAHVVSLGYKIDYAIEKGLQCINHIMSNPDLSNFYVRKVKVGELDDCDKFYL